MHVYTHLSSEERLMLLLFSKRERKKSIWASERDKVANSLLEKGLIVWTGKQLKNGHKEYRLTLEGGRVTREL